MLDNQCLECGGSFDPDLCHTCYRQLHYECGIICDFCNNLFCTQHSEVKSHECIDPE